MGHYYNTINPLIRMVGLALLLGFVCLPARGNVPKEYEIKAAFIANFVRFVQWPKSTVTKRPILFGVLGENPFGNALEPVKKQTFKGRKAKIEYFPKWTEQIKDIDVVFISRSGKKHIDTILNLLKRRPVLTISDIEGFARQGGMIQFVEREGSIHFIINIMAVKSAGLEMNFQLLQLADEVIGR